MGLQLGAKRGTHRRDYKLMFDFDLVEVGELDEAMNAGRYSQAVREIIAKATGQKVEELTKMSVNAYKKLVANFVKAAYDPVDADPN